MPGNIEKSIDELVREVRSQAYPDSKDGTKHLCKTMRMLRVNHPVPVDGIYVKLNVLNRISGDFSFSDWQRNFQSNPSNFDRWGLGTVNQSQVSALSMVQKSLRLMVLGKPGSGKTTFLKSLLVECVEGRLRWNQQDYVPIFITLKDFAKASQKQLQSNLSNYIYQEFCSWGLRDSLKERQVVEKILAEGRALILLDGLDEVPEEIDEKSQELDQESVINEILNFSKSNNRIVITCRTSQKYMWEGFTDVEIAYFEQEEREEFIKKWFAVVNGNAESDKLAEQLIWQLQEPKNPQIAKLAVTPILLNLICIRFQDGDGKLPKNRADFYEDGVTILLKEWDATKPAKGVKRKTVHNCLKEIDDKKRLLAQVAAILFEQNDYLHKQEKLKKIISKELDVSLSKAEEVIKSFEEQSGLMVERYKGFWSFSHLTFQEYFTAKWFCDQADLEGLAKHVREKHWREVLLLAIDMLPSADRLLDLMKQQVDKLVAIDEELQKFLTEVNQTSLKFKTSCKRADVRAYYLNPARDSSFIPTGARNLNLSNTFDFDRIHDSNGVLNLAHDLDHIHDLARGFVLAPVVDQTFFASAHPNHNDYFNGHVSGIASGYKHGPSRAVNGERMYRDNSLTWKFDTEQFKHDLAQEVSKLTHDLTRNLTYTLSRTMFIYDLTLKQTLQDLTNQLPDLDSDTYKWWKAEGQAWTRQLIEAMIEHCHVGHAWRFRPEQKELLNKYYDYYDANKLLVDCLNSGCNVSDDVRNEIEETLLLPIDEIKKR